MLLALLINAQQPKITLLALVATLAILSTLSRMAFPATAQLLAPPQANTGTLEIPAKTAIPLAKLVSAP